MTASPQQGITQSLRLNQSDILTLNSSPFVIIPAEAGFVNVLTRASISYVYRTSVFTNVDNLLSFAILNAPGDTTLVSNSLNAQNILGIDQNTNVSFIPANPYSALITASENKPIVFKIGGSDPIGGDASSSILISFTYSIFEV